MSEQYLSSSSNPFSRNLFPRVNSWVPRSVAVIIVIAVGFTLLPALNRRGCGCGRVSCGTNMHQVLSLIVDYADSHHGNLPPTVTAIQEFAEKKSGRKSDIFHCPDGSKPYVYCGGGMNRSTTARDTVVLYEPLGNHTGGKRNQPAIYIAQLDGSVHLLISPQAEHVLTDLDAGRNPSRATLLK